MDIFAHGLWAAAGAAGAKRKWNIRIRPLHAAAWGMFPDLFAFTVPVLLTFRDRWLHPELFPAGSHRGGHFDLGWQLYQVSHSLIVFGAVFGLAWVLFRRPVLAMLAWLLHVLIDIPTHTYRFFPTPFLWPLSDYRTSGISWGNRWFLIANYSGLAAAYLALWLVRRRERMARGNELPQDVRA